MVICCVLLVAGEASAAVKLKLRPTIADMCPTATSWGGITSCLAKHGTAKLLRKHQGARLVRWTGGKDGDAMMLLYVERNGGWQIGGQDRDYNRDSQLLAFEPITVGKRTGYRIEIGRASPLPLLIDGISPVDAELRTKESLFCGGDSRRCAGVTTSCEVLVRGSARFAFRGTIVIEDDTVHVKGDRSKASEHCDLSEGELLDWAPPRPPSW